jgi:outer membrane protein OmpA-like peptidoglycan-associated protein
VLKNHPEIVKLRVEGHTDSQGSSSSNLTLSQARAQAVLTYLTNAGVPADRLSSEGYGEDRPLDKRETRAAWEKNRRVELMVERWAEGF